jgi:hypothetical protein
MRGNEVFDTLFDALSLSGFFAREDEPGALAREIVAAASGMAVVFEEEPVPRSGRIADFDWPERDRVYDEERRRQLGLFDVRAEVGENYSWTNEDAPAAGGRF